MLSVSRHAARPDRSTAYAAALARSIAHLFPYLVPLNHLQVELLRRYRNRAATADADADAGDGGADRLQRGRIAH